MSISDDMGNFEQDWRKAELVPGDLIWQFGKVTDPAWTFIGLPGTKWTPSIGVSYYFVTGIEDSVTRAGLEELVS